MYILTYYGNLVETR